jgi:hypothetical protein
VKQLLNSILPSDREVATLQYASPRIEKPTRSLYRSAIALALTPMVLGGLALLLCYAMRWGWGPDRTMLLVALSVALVFAGMVQLLFFCYREWRQQRLSRGALQLHFYLGVLLLLCNVPVLSLYTIAPQKLTRRTTVTVINNGPATIDRFVVNNQGTKTDIGPVAPGKTVKGTFYLPMNGYLSFEAWQIRVNSTSMSGGSLPGRKGDHTITFTGAGLSSN